MSVYAYVESNFVLELAFAQGESEACEAILDLAEARRIELVLPAFSISEPYDTLKRREKKRSKLHGEVSDELNQLGRTASYADQVESLIGPLGVLVRSSEDETHRLDRALGRIVDVAQLIPVDAAILKRAIDLRSERGLPPQDAIVYASVLGHLEATSSEDPKRFLNKNTRDFLTPDIVSDLAPFSCQVLPSFAAGLAWIRAELV